MFVVAGFNFTCSLFIILISYIYIFPATLRIRSTEGRHKAFSTCGSHLTAVTIFYTTVFFMYLIPPSEESAAGENGGWVVHHSDSMLKPVIYSLRNKDVKEALIKDLFSRKLSINR